MSDSDLSCVWHVGVNKKSRVTFSLIPMAFLMAGLGGCGAHTPGFCSSLEHSSALAGLRGALIDLASPATRDRGRSVIRSAADDLKDIGGDAPSSVQAAFANAASALDSLATNGITNAAAVSAVSNALGNLGSEVESECHFSIG